MKFVKAVVQKIRSTGELKQKWEFATKGAITTTPTCVDINSDGREEILIGTQNGELICLSTIGQKLWVYDARKQMSAKTSIFMDKTVVDSIYSQPIVINLHTKKQGIVFGNEAGVVTCLDANGKLMWKFEAKGGIRATPIAFDINGDDYDEIIVGSRDKNVYCLSSTGKLVWSYEASSGIEGTAAISHGKIKQIVVGANDGTLTSLSITGKKQWVFKTDGKIIAQPVIADISRTGEESILIGSSDGHLYVLRLDGGLLWDYRTKGRIVSRVMVADVDNDGELEIFFGSCDDQIHALAPNGQVMWTYETGFWVAAPVYVTDVDRNGSLEVVAGSYDKNLYILAARGNFSLDHMPGIASVAQQSGSYSHFVQRQAGKLIGKVLWKYNVDDVITSMSILHDLTERDILVGTKDGKLLCLQHTR